MNIFFLHRSAPICAQYHADKHVVKMILECAQLLSSAHHHFGHQVTYKATHMNHPCAIWTRGSRLQYMFVSDLAKALCREYAIRFGKQHKTSELIHGELLLPPAELTNSKWSDPPLVMPDEFKGKDIIESYQRYYASKNDTMSLRWFSGKRLPPLWFTLNINEMEQDVNANELADELDSISYDCSLEEWRASPIGNAAAMLRQLQTENEALKKEAALQRLSDFTQEADNEPVAWAVYDHEFECYRFFHHKEKDGIPLYTHPAQELNDGGEPVKNATYWKRQYNEMSALNDRLKSSLYHANEQIKYLEFHAADLTDEEIMVLYEEYIETQYASESNVLGFGRAILRKAQEK